MRRTTPSSLSASSSSMCRGARPSPAPERATGTAPVYAACAQDRRVAVGDGEDVLGAVAAEQGRHAGPELEGGSGRSVSAAVTRPRTGGDPQVRRRRSAAQGVRRHRRCPHPAVHDRGGPPSSPHAGLTDAPHAQVNEEAKRAIAHLKLEQTYIAAGECLEFPFEAEVCGDR
jgi:hypothetical protein